MAFSKYTGVEKAKVLSPEQHKAVQSELRRMGKTTAQGLSKSERQSLKVAMDLAEESC